MSSLSALILHPQLGDVVLFMTLSSTLNYDREVEKFVGNDRVDPEKWKGELKARLQKENSYCPSSVKDLLTCRLVNTSICYRIDQFIFSTTIPALRFDIGTISQLSTTNFFFRHLVPVLQTLLRTAARSSSSTALSSFEDLYSALSTRSDNDDDDDGISHHPSKESFAVLFNEALEPYLTSDLKYIGPTLQDDGDATEFFEENAELRRDTLVYFQRLPSTPWTLLSLSQKAIPNLVSLSLNPAHFDFGREISYSRRFGSVSHRTCAQVQEAPQIPSMLPAGLLDCLRSIRDLTIELNDSTTCVKQGGSDARGRQDLRSRHNRVHDINVATIRNLLGQICGVDSEGGELKNFALRSLSISDSAEWQFHEFNSALPPAVLNNLSSLVLCPDYHSVSRVSEEFNKRGIEFEAVSDSDWDSNLSDDDGDDMEHEDEGKPLDVGGTKKARAEREANAVWSSCLYADEAKETLRSVASEQPYLKNLLSRCRVVSDNKNRANASLLKGMLDNTSLLFSKLTNLEKIDFYPSYTFEYDRLPAYAFPVYSLVTHCKKLVKIDLSPWTNESIAIVGKHLGHQITHLSGTAEFRSTECVTLCMNLVAEYFPIVQETPPLVSETGLFRSKRKSEVDQEHLAALRRLAQKCPRIQQIHLRLATPEFLLEIYPKFRSLTKVYIYLPRTSESIGSMMSNLSECEAIESSKLWASAVVDALKSGTGELEKLEINEAKTSGGWRDIAVLPEAVFVGEMLRKNVQLKKLQKFELNSILGLSLEGTLMMAKYLFPSVKTIASYGPYQTDHRVRMKVHSASDCLSLREKWPGIPDTASNPHLKSVQWTFCTGQFTPLSSSSDDVSERSKSKLEVRGVNIVTERNWSIAKRRVTHDDKKVEGINPGVTVEQYINGNYEGRYTKE